MRIEEREEVRTEPWVLQCSEVRKMRRIYHRRLKRSRHEVDRR